MFRLYQVFILICIVGLSSKTLPGETKQTAGSNFGPEQMKQVTRLFGRLATFGTAKFALRNGVAEELKLSTTQIDQLTELGNKGNARNLAVRFQKEIAGLENATSTQFKNTIEDMEDAATLLNDDAKAMIADILDTEQKQRLGELQFQYAISQGNVMGALATSGMNVDAKKKGDLESAIAGANIIIDEEVTKLRRDAYLKAIGPVVGEQELKTAIGAPFEFPSLRRQGTPYKQVGTIK